MGEIFFSGILWGNGLMWKNLYQKTLPRYDNRTESHSGNHIDLVTRNLRVFSTNTNIRNLPENTNK